MLVQALSELLQHGVLGISRNSLYDQLPPRHADRQRVALVMEEECEPVCDAVDRNIEQWVPARIDRVLVEGDRELDEKICEIARKGCHPRPRGRSWRGGRWNRL